MKMKKISKKEFKQTKEQKSMGWTCIIIGVILTLTVLGALVGIPLIIVGIYYLRTKKSIPIFNWMRNQELIRKKLEKEKKKE